MSDPVLKTTRTDPSHQSSLSPFPTTSTSTTTSLPEPHKVHKNDSVSSTTHNSDTDDISSPKKMSPPLDSNLSLSATNTSVSSLQVPSGEDQSQANFSQAHPAPEPGPDPQPGNESSPVTPGSNQTSSTVPATPADGPDSSKTTPSTTSKTLPVTPVKDTNKGDQKTSTQQTELHQPTLSSSVSFQTHQPIHFTSRSQRPSQHQPSHLQPSTGSANHQQFLTNHRFDGTTTYITTSSPTPNQQSVLRSTTTKTSKQGTIGKNHPEHELVYDMMVGMRTRFAALEQQEFQAAAKAAKNLRDSQQITGSTYLLDDEGIPNASSATATIQSTPSIQGEKPPSQPLKLNILPPPPPYTPQALDPLEFRTHVKQHFPKKGSMFTPPVQLDEFKFKDYCPKVFRAIRQFFGIHPIEYINSVCGNAEYIEFISNSKSGEFFCYTNDLRYMIKTISKQESLFLRNILPAYYAHTMDNPHTLLTRFFGMYRVSSRQLTQTHFLLMGSVFFTEFQDDIAMTRVYDMKGSSQGRSVTEKEKQRENCVYKDNDFLEHNRKIVLKPHISAKLREQIVADVQFLRKMQVMDYSLLIGIVDLEKQEQYSVPLLDAHGDIMPVIYLDATTGQPIMDRHVMEVLHEGTETDELTDISHRFQVTGFQQSQSQSNLNQQQQQTSATTSPAQTQSSTPAPTTTQSTTTATTDLPAPTFSDLPRDSTGAKSTNQHTHPAAVATIAAGPEDYDDFGRLSAMNMNTAESQHSTAIRSSSKIDQQPTENKTDPSLPKMTKAFSSNSNSLAPAPNSTFAPQIPTPHAVLIQRKKQPTAHLPKHYQPSGKLHDVNPNFEPFHPIPGGQTTQPLQPLLPQLASQQDTYDDQYEINRMTIEPIIGGQPGGGSNQPRDSHHDQGVPSLSRSPSSHHETVEPLGVFNPAQPIIALAPSDVVVAPSDDVDLQPIDERARARTIVQKEKKQKKDKKDTKIGTIGGGGDIELQQPYQLKRRQTISNYDYPNTWQPQAPRPSNFPATGEEDPSRLTLEGLPPQQGQNNSNANPHLLSPLSFPPILPLTEPSGPEVQPQQPSGFPPHTSSPTPTHGIKPTQPLNVIIPSPQPDASLTKGEPGFVEPSQRSPSYIAVVPAPAPAPIDTQQFEMDEDDDIITTSIFTQDMGGIRGSGPDRNKIFYLGIIDVLTFYNWRKKGENWLKGLRYDKDQISAVSPEHYADRFINFMDDYVICDDTDPHAGLIKTPDQQLEEVDAEQLLLDQMTPAQRKKHLAKKEEERKKLEKKREAAKKEEDKKREAAKKEEEKRLQKEMKENAKKAKEEAKKKKE